MADLFGDASLFEEFEKDREAENSFIRYDENTEKSRIIFEGFNDSDGDDEEDSDSEWGNEIFQQNNQPPVIPEDEPEPTPTPDADASATVADGEKAVISEENKDSQKDEGDCQTIADASKDEQESPMETSEKGTESEELKLDEVKNESGEIKEEGEANDENKSNENTEEVANKNTLVDSSETILSASVDEEAKKPEENKKEEFKPPKPALSFSTSNAAKLLEATTLIIKEKKAKRAKEEAEKKLNAKKREELTEEDNVWLHEHLYSSSEKKAAEQNLKDVIKEKNKYHRYCKILDSTRYVPDEDSPAIQLLFNNTKFARKYRQQIEQFIKGLLWQEMNSSNPDTVSEITMRPGAPSCVDINDKLPPEKRVEKMRQKHALLGNCQFHKQFLIDFMGWPFTTAEPPRCNINWEIPLYGQVFDQVYADPANKPKDQPGAKRAEKCSVVQCRLPRNQARIAANRKAFMDQSSKQEPKFTGPTRYHLDPDISSKFNKFRPGMISEGLREALGLSETQLPQHIYKMRLFGYPPGWLATAKQVESGVSIYDKDGRATLGSGEKLEDGELNDNGSAIGTEYDVSKIVEYPGFTVPTPLGTVDEHGEFKMPPIQEHQLKNTLMAQSQEKLAERKRKREQQAEEEKEMEAKKMKMAQEEEQATAAENGVEAETSNGDSEKPKDESEEKENTEESMDSEEKSKSEAAEDKPAGDTGDGNDSDATEEMNDEAAAAEADQSANQSMQEADQSTNQSMQEENASLSTSKLSISCDFGTPILMRHKSSLPDARQFGAGVEEHIPFENLPDSTGTFEKMRSIIGTIRNKIKKSE